MRRIAIRAERAVSEGCTGTRLPLGTLGLLLGGNIVLSSRAEEFRAFARECLEMAEASHVGLRQRLIELSRQ